MTKLDKNEKNELQLFNFEGEEVRVLEIEGEPYFVGKDVATILDYANPQKALRDHIEIEDKIMGEQNVTPSIKDPLGRTQYPTWINESGLYSLIFGSKLDNAKHFKRWVTSEVLPSIRKHGAYMTENTLEKALTSPDFLIQLATKLKDEQTKRKELEEEKKRNETLVTFANRCLTSKDSILVRELAKIITDEGYNIGEKRLYKKLREWGLILKYNTEPSQKGMDLELFEVLQRTKDTPYGEKLIKTTKVTPKGQVYITERLLKELK